MDIEIPDNIKHMIKVQQNFIKNNKATFDIIDSHNTYLQNIYDQSNIKYIDSVVSRYDSLINAVGDSIYITTSPAYNFYKTDYYKNIYSNLPNFDMFIPDLFKEDFRIKVQSQKLTSQIDLIVEKFNNISNPKVNEFEIEFDKLISEPLIDTTDNNQKIDGTADIKRMIAEIHESQKRQEKAFQEEVKNREQSNPSNKSCNNFFDKFQLLIIVVFSLITKPKEIYEGVLWINDILEILINYFT